MAKKLEDLPIHARATEFCAAVTAILGRSQLRRDRKLYDQISNASDSVLSNMYEGFEQGSDAAFASYLQHAKASAAEVGARLECARVKGLVTDEQCRATKARADELQRMLAGLIRYLRECDWKDRGRHSRVKDPKPR